MIVAGPEQAIFPVGVLLIWPSLEIIQARYNNCLHCYRNSGIEEQP